MARLGADLLDLEPDVVVIASNDHLENFFLHCVPSFVVHCGVGGRLVRRPQLRVPGRQRDRPRPRESSPGRRLRSGVQPHRRHWVRVRHPADVLRDRHVDPHRPDLRERACRPAASSERCYSLGKALDRASRRPACGRDDGERRPLALPRHRPLLPPRPDDRRRRRAPAGGEPAIADHVRRRRAGSHGQRRARSWQILAGALGERANHFTQESSWHHDYAVLGWTTSEQPAAEELHYPPVVAERLALSSALYRLRMEAPVRRRFLDDPAAFVEELGLDADERAALEALDEPQLQKLGVHPLLAPWPGCKSTSSAGRTSRTLCGGCRLVPVDRRREDQSRERPSVPSASPFEGRSLPRRAGRRRRPRRRGGRRGGGPSVGRQGTSGQRGCARLRTSSTTSRPTRRDADRFVGKPRRMSALEAARRRPAAAMR